MNDYKFLFLERQLDCVAAAELGLTFEFTLLCFSETSWCSSMHPKALKFKEEPHFK